MRRLFRSCPAPRRPNSHHYRPKRKSRMPLSRNIRLNLFQRNRSLDRFLQFLGGAEGNLLARLDLDGFARRRIAAHAGSALAHDEDTQTVQTDAGALLQVLGDRRDRVVEERMRRLVGHLVLLGQLHRQLARADRFDFWFRGHLCSYCHLIAPYSESVDARIYCISENTSDGPMREMPIFQGLDDLPTEMRQKAK